MGKSTSRSPPAAASGARRRAGATSRSRCHNHSRVSQKERPMARLAAVTRVLVLSLVLASPMFAQQHDHASSSTEKLGVVSFSTSCSANAQPLFNRAVALLHSFE